MKILCLCIAVVLLASVASGEAIATLDSLRVAVARQLNQPDSGNTNMTKAETITAINRAAQQVCRDFPAFEVVDTITTTEGTMAYALDSNFVAMDWCIDDGGVPVAGVKVFNDQVFFAPEPATGDVYYLAYYAVSTKLSNDTGTVVIRPTYREPVVIYACYILSMQRGRIVDAQAYLEQYRGLIAQ